MEEYKCVCHKSFKTKERLVRHQQNCKLYIEREKRKLPNGLFKCENPKCGKLHDGSYGTGRFCSKKCRMVWIGIESNKTMLKNGNKPNNICSDNNHHIRRTKCGQRAKYGRWKCLKCNIIFNTRAEYYSHNKKEHPIEPGSSWNKGLTKEDPRVSSYLNTIQQKLKSGEIIPSMTGKHHSEERKKQIRESTIKYIESTKGPMRVRYNKNSISVIESIGEEHGWNLQHAENGGEVYVDGYWLDGYDKDNNVVVEYDESRHYKDPYNNILIDKDIIRQNYIIEHLQCDFYRYNEVTGKLWKVN